MTEEAHPLLRLAAPHVREQVAERLGVTTDPAPEPPPEPVDPGDVITRLRSGRGKDPRYVLDGVAVVDWDSIVREHRRAPLPDVIGAALVARDDCPAHAALALVVARSTSRRALATSTLASALLHGAVTPRQVMFEAAPGWSALRSLEKYACKYGQWLVPVRRVLEEAARLLPGDHLPAWLWLVEHGPRHPGTFPEICAAARAIPDDTAFREAPPPARAGRRPGPPPSRQPDVNWDLGSPVGLLSRIRPDLAAKIIAALPVSTVNGFLGTPDLPASVVVAAVRRVPQLTGQLVRQTEMTAYNVRPLLALHDPEVNSTLATAAPDRPEITLEVHRATRRDRRRTVPLTPKARHDLAHKPDRPRLGLATAVHGHTPSLILAAFDQLGELLGAAAALRGMLSLWECQGPQAVRDAAARPSIDGAVRQTVLRALDAPDGIAALTAEVARHENPDALLAAIRRQPALAYQPPPSAFWPVAVAAHAREPLPPGALRALAGHTGCPDVLRLDGCRLDPSLAKCHAGRSRAYALTAASHSLGVNTTAWQTPRNTWYLTALADRLITAAEFVDLAHPVHHMITVLDDIRAVLPEAHTDALAHLRDGLHRVAGTDPEAWTIAAHLFPEFVGTFPELLATVDAVTA